MSLRCENSQKNEFVGRPYVRRKRMRSTPRTCVFCLRASPPAGVDEWISARRARVGPVGANCIAPYPLLCVSPGQLYRQLEPPFGPAFSVPRPSAQLRRARSSSRRCAPSSVLP